MNCSTLFTENEMSGLVNERYCKPPTMLRYLLASVIAWPLVLDKMLEGHAGVEIPLADAMFALAKRSTMYLD